MTQKHPLAFNGAGRRLLGSVWHVFFALLFALAPAVSVRAAEPPAKKTFNVPAGTAVETLKRAAQQAGLEIMFPADTVKGVRTHAVKGEYAPLDAIKRMLVGTDLTAVFDEQTGALAIRRRDSSDADTPPVKSSGGPVPQSAGNAPVTASSGEQTLMLDEFVVSGSLLSIRRAIAEKRADVVISDAISADEIGSIPDFGLGEALERVPGVSMIINNGRGESQFATLRGLRTDYNAVLIDGLQLPSTETDRRAVSLDIIPSSLAKGMSTFKTFTPDMDGNAIGGIINLRTRSAYDSPGFFVSARGNYGFYENERELHKTTPSGQAELTLSNTFGAKQQFGLVVSTSYFRRDSSSLNSAIDTYSFYNAAGASVALTSPDVASATPVPDRRRWLAYDNIRERNGLFGKFEFRGANTFQAHLTGGFFQHLNDEARQSNILVRAATPVITSATTGTVATANAQADYAGFNQDRRIIYGEFGASIDPTPDSRLEFVTHYAIGDYHQDAKLDTYRIANTTALAYAYDGAPGQMPYFGLLNDSTYDGAANYRQFEHGWAADDNREDILTVALDYGHNARPESDGLGFKLGAKFRYLDRTYDFWEENYRPTSATLTLASALDPRAITPYNGRGQRLLAIDPAAAQRLFETNRSLYPLNSTNVARNLQSDYDLTEGVTSAYAMALYRRDRFTAIAGARFEATALETASNVTRTVSGVTGYVREERSSDYNNLLPSANAAYDLTRNLRLRAAVSRSLSRPDYAALAARSVITDDGAGAVTISSGNPDLKPRKSDNYDLSLEWYFSKDAMFSTALFRKDLTNEFLRTASIETANVNGVSTTTTTTTWRNLDRARIDGVELTFTDTRFEFLPGPLAGLGVQANATFLDVTTPGITMSNGTVRKLPSLIESPKVTFNAALLYSLGKFSAQLSYKHTDPMLVSVATSNVVDDRYYRTNETFDAQVRYKINQQWSVTLQAKNFTNERPARMIGLRQELLREELDNGRSWFAGVSYVFK